MKNKGTMEYSFDVEHSGQSINVRTQGGKWECVSVFELVERLSSFQKKVCKQNLKDIVKEIEDNKVPVAERDWDQAIMDEYFNAGLRQAVAIIRKHIKKL